MDGSKLVDFDTFRGQLRRFQRSSVLQAALQCLWSEWAKGSSPEPIDGSGNRRRPELERYYLRAFGSRVAVLAAVDCNDYRSRKFSQELFRRCCRAYIRLEQAIDDEAQVEELYRAIQTSDVLCRYATPTREECRVLAVELALDRMTSDQWRHRMTDALDSIARSSILIDRLAARLGGAVRAQLRRVLGTEPRNFLVTAFGLFTMAMQGRGVIDLRDPTVEDELRRRLDVDADVLRLVARHLSWDFETLRIHENAARQRAPRTLRHHCPNPLALAPLILVGEKRFIAPCPFQFSVFLEHVGLSVLTRDLDGALRDRFRTELGNVLSDYFDVAVRSLCPDAKVLHCDRLGISNQKRADFVLLAPPFGLVVEIKKSVADAETKSLGLAGDTVRLWERLLVPAEQCASTVAWARSEPNLVGVNRWASIVCIDDTLVHEGGRFSAYAQQFGIFKKLSLDNLEFAKLQFLEDLLQVATVPEVVSAIEGKWQEAEIATPLATYLGRAMPKFMKRPKKKGPAEHLREAHVAIFGDAE